MNVQLFRLGELLKLAIDTVQMSQNARHLTLILTSAWSRSKRIMIVHYYQFFCTVQRLRKGESLYSVGLKSHVHFLPHFTSPNQKVATHG